MSDLTPPSIPSASAAVTPAPGPRRRRRWLKRVLIAVPLLLIALVLLTPTLLSLGFVRTMLLPTISRAVAPNGKLEIAAWRFGWFGGQRIEGIRLLDDRNAVVAHLNVKTGASLWSLARGNYALGETTVTGDFDVRIDPATGRVNALHIMGADGDEPAARPKREKKPEGESSGSPVDLAKLKGRVTVNLTGTISASNGDAKSVPFTKVTTGMLVVDLNDLEHGVPIDGRLQLSVNDKPAVLTIKGTIEAIEKGLIVTDPNRLGADLVAGIDQLDLAILKAGLVAMGIEDVAVAGVMQGRVVIDAKPGGAGSIRAESLGIDDFVAVAPQLKGDTLRSKRIDFPLSITRVAGSDEVRIESLGVITDLATVNATGTVSPRALQNLAAGNAPGAASQLIIRSEAPSFAAIALMLPHAVRLQQGVEVTGGGASHVVQVDVLPDAAKATQSLTLSVAGTSDGKAIRIEKTTVDASADLALRDGVPFDAKSVRAFALSVAAPFANISGGGVPEKMRLIGKADLTRLTSDVGQFVDLGALVLKGTADFTLDTAGLPTGAGVFGAQLNLVANGLIVSNGGTSYLSNENVKGDVNLLLKQAGDVMTITFRKLNVGTDSGLFGLWTTGDDAWVTLKNGVPMGGVGEFRLRGNASKLIEPFAAGMDPSLTLTRGTVDGGLTLSVNDTGSEYKAVTQIELSKLDLGKLLVNEKVTFGSTAFVPSEFNAARASFVLSSGFVNAKGNANVVLSRSDGKAVTPFESAQSVSFDGAVPSLPKLYALIESLGATANAQAADQELTPLAVESGDLTFSGKLTRNEATQTNSVVLNVPGVNDLTLARGNERFRLREPITFALAADVVTDGRKSTVAEQLQRAVVSKLVATIPGIASVTLPQPIELASLSAKAPDAKGVIRFEAQAQPLGELLAVVNGSNPLPAAGSFTSEQRIVSNGGRISLSGTSRLSNIRPLGPDAKPLPERLQTIELMVDLTADLSAMSATIRNLDVSAPAARDVLALNVVGTVRDLGTKNTFDGEGVKATLAYDLAQLWPLVQPFVDPTGESIGRIENLAGTYGKTITVSGSYPTADAAGNAIEFKDAIRSVIVGGDLQLDRADLVDLGVQIENLAAPFTVKGGVARVAYSDGSLPADFAINSGKGKLGGLSIDLTTDEPTLPIIKNFPLLRGVTLNPIMSSALGKFFNPVFPNATKARALVDVTLSTDKLRLGESLTAANSGRATLVLSLTDMEISNPLGEQLFGGLINQGAAFFKIGGIDTQEFSNFRGEMRDATFTLDRGVVTQDATFMIGNIDGRDDAGKPKLYPFTFGGDVRLADQAMNLSAGLPLQILKRKLSGDLAKFLPDSIPVSFTGTTSTPRINFSKDVQSIFADAGLKLGAEKLLGGGKTDGKANGETQSTEDKLNQALDDLFGGGGNDAAKDDAKREAKKPPKDAARDDKPRSDPGPENTPKKKPKKDDGK